MTNNKKSGVTGITWCKHRDQWLVRGFYSHEGKRKHVYLGYYTDLDEATDVLEKWFADRDTKKRLAGSVQQSNILKAQGNYMFLADGNWQLRLSYRFAGMEKTKNIAIGKFTSLKEARKAKRIKLDQLYREYYKR